MSGIGNWAAVVLFCGSSFAGAASAQTPASAVVNERLPGYADLADLALAAPVVVVVTVHDTYRLKGADAADVPAGRVRLYVEGDVDQLIAGPGGLPARVDWLVDVTPDSSNHIPKLKKQRFILLARKVPGKQGTLQLVARGAQLPWSPALEQRLRTILSDALKPQAPPAITGIDRAFHTAGTIPGEGETQIFLKTANRRPVSLSIVRRPGEAPRWSVALSEIVDDAATAPPRDTLLWYRLACGLPPTLPESALADQSPEDAAQAQADYRLVLDSLGPCGRTQSPD